MARWISRLGAGSDRVTVQLGSYEEQFRLYLFGRAPFPDDAVLGMFVAVMADTQDQIATTPVPLDVNGYHHYELIIPGIKFEIMLGQRMPHEARGACLLRSPDLVFLIDHLGHRSMEALRKTARVTRKVQIGANLYKKDCP